MDKVAGRSVDADLTSMSHFAPHGVGNRVSGQMLLPACPRLPTPASPPVIRGVTMAGTRYPVRLIFAAMIAALMAVFPGVSAMAQSHAVGESVARAASGTSSKAKENALHGPQVFGWGFTNPSAVASD